MTFPPIALSPAVPSSVASLAAPGASSVRCDDARLAFVGTSARSLVESARVSRLHPIALDVFGDLDTCRLAEACVRIDGNGLAMGRDQLLAALAQLRARGDVAGWVAGSGFEAQLELLAEGARVLPFLGNRPETVRRVRTPAVFAAVLDALAIAHPGFSRHPPVDPRGWLLKDAHACGGWHVRPAQAASAARLGAGGYFQRQVAGEPFSCLFLAAGEAAQVVGFSRQIVRALGGRQYVYRGGVGPVVVPDAVQEALTRAAQALTGVFGLVGLNGIDYVLDAAGQPWVLELNPRPTAAIQLFDEALEGGLMRAHVDACTGRRRAFVATTGSPVRGFETVFARRAGQIDPARSAWLLAQEWCCDIPQAGTCHAWGDPLCTVRAQGASVDAVLQQLNERRRTVALHLQPRLENPAAC